MNNGALKLRLQYNLQASLEDDNYECLFFSTFKINKIGAEFETRKRKHVHFQDESLIWKNKSNEDKIGSRGIIFLYHQCMMIDCLNGGIK